MANTAPGLGYNFFLVGFGVPDRPRPAARLTDADGQGVVLLAALRGRSLHRHLCRGLLARPRVVIVVSAGGSLAVKIALAVKVAPADKVALADMVAPAVKVINGGTLAVVAIVVGPRPSAALDAAPVTP